MDQWERIRKLPRFLQGIQYSQYVYGDKEPERPKKQKADQKELFQEEAEGH
jgi:hypothetical protein